MTLILVVALSAAQGIGTTPEDYFRRSFHAPTAEKRLELLNKALEMNPNYVPALRHRSGVYAALGRKEQALADGARAADLSPGDADINSAAGALAEDLGKFDVAARYCGRALALDPKSPPLRARLIAALLKLRKTDEALKEADVLVEQYPQEDFPYSIRSEAYEWADRYADAVRDLTVLIGRHPNEPKYYLQRCINYRCFGEGQKALDDAEKGLQLKGNTGYAYAARGCSFETLGQLDKALEDYQKAAELDEDKRYFNIWSCLVLRKLGRRTDADKLIRDFRKDLKDDKWIAPVIKYLAGEMTEDEVFKLAKDEDPEKQRNQLCEAYYYIGACYLADKKLDRAEELFKLCLAQRVNNFYEHGFALRDLRTVQKLRGKPAPDKGGPGGGEARPK